MAGRRVWRAAVALLVGPALVAGLVLVAGCTAPAERPGHRPRLSDVDSWVYQLQGYPGGRLDRLAKAPQPLAVIDLTRDGRRSYFSRAEVGALRDSGKLVLAYFEVGSIEDFRPEYAGLDRGLLLDDVSGWPGERFVRYWSDDWWRTVVRPRIDRAIAAGYDGAYLDTLLAYQEIDLARVPGRDRAGLAADAVALVRRISAYAKARRPGFLVVPQNSPELGRRADYRRAIDGIGIEELYFQDTDEACRADFCAENRTGVRRLRDAGKLVLAVDYARRPANRAAACAAYRREGFAGYVTTVDLDTASAPCPGT